MLNPHVPAAATGLPSPACTILAFPTFNHRLPSLAEHDANSRTRLGSLVATLASAVSALDLRFAPIPRDLDAARELARAVVAASAAGVPITESRASEAAYGLAAALRRLHDAMEG